ncbi:PBS lyase HEAT domain protein repeat-containing protein (plasmid) [Thalassoporum mexicanum PCC 7367]|uniref:HEAT repeat domain-containing protein n=1 Tax=Thalassoporum mexicanum TaxID=3457544 RepID=UPI00029FBBEF|nr:HEAT repeat domain-containing protein [Pseudanabaena sp. PCC 7367]AFY72109.1 PBS lyase HEAT domain protein repeat-containing protein [Pseudanabaena sp. PCC 7367]
MDKRFANLFNLSEDEAIALLDTPGDQLGEQDSRYIAAAHLVNFKTSKTIAALIRAVQRTDPDLENRIVRRKAVETLGRLQATEAIPVIRACLDEEDNYLIENAVWAIGEIGKLDRIEPSLLAEVTQLLEKPGQTYRVIIHTLTSLNYELALPAIRKFTASEDLPTASAALTSIYRFTGDHEPMQRVLSMLQSDQVLARRLAIQDLVDARYYEAIAAIARTPVSLVFRLRGIRLLAEMGMAEGKIDFEQQVAPHLEQTLRDHPADLELVHEYDQPPDLAFLVRELYQTDFGRCYLALKTLLMEHAEVAPAALFDTYEAEAKADYGAHFHVIKLFGWLNHAPAYAMLQHNLHHPQPQFQKSRAAAAIALAEIAQGNEQVDKQTVINELKSCLDTRIWDLKYALLLALEQLGDSGEYARFSDDPDFLIRAKAQAKLAPIHHQGDR